MTEPTAEATGKTNTVRLSRTLSGYTWAITIDADSNSQDDLNATVDKAIVTDARLTANYGPLEVIAKARSTKAQ
jgi:hypothetical protein